MSRREKVRIVSERVGRRIGEVTPAGLGAHAWDFTRPFVQPYEDPYLDALNAWKREDTDDTRATLQRAARLYIGAWKRAAFFTHPGVRLPVL